MNICVFVYLTTVFLNVELVLCIDLSQGLEILGCLELNFFWRWEKHSFNLSYKCIEECHIGGIGKGVRTTPDHQDPTVNFHFFFFFSLRQSLALVAQDGVQWLDLGSPQPPFLGLGNSPVSASWVAGITGTHHHAQLIFGIFSRGGVSPCWPGLSPSLDLMIHPPRPPKVLGFQAWVTAPDLNENILTAES